MPTLQKKIETILNSKEEIPASPLGSLLSAASALYGAAQKIRASCYRQNLLQSRKLPCDVISVGNLTVGGTGKTPMTIYVARKLQQAGMRVAVISRGYKGSAERDGGVVSDGSNLLMNSEQAGDESFLIASRLKNIPVIVGKNRFAAGMLAIRNFQPEIIVLDDAFQHLKLRRDIDIILLDYTRPFGNAHLMPRGMLREPVTALTRATACVLTRSPTGPDEAASTTLAGVKTFMPDIPIFTSVHDPYMYTVKGGVPTPFNTISHFMAPHDSDQIKYRKVYGFSGIARNDDFKRTVATLGFTSMGFSEFPDHHKYSRDDLEKTVRTAGATGAECLITTEKDHARIAHKKPLAMDLVVVGVKIDFGNDEQKFISFIQSRLQQ
ncbi:MAG: tetraacyldisaccharide 4'-kinase [Desulfobacteraceae bacterium]|jgi:tetraacyldisaccharide 4'-kinase|nr:tetraacyldisaccharide 4'-kinase [Desulfobacteraceae bacterium]